MKALNIFNHYLERGGEAYAVDAIVTALAKDFPVERCDFSSAEWTGENGPPIWRQPFLTFSNPQSLRRLRAKQARFRPDFWLVHNVFPVGSAAVYREAGSLGVPIIQYLHNFRPFSVSGDLWAGNRLAPGALAGNYWDEIRYGTWRNSRAKTAFLALVLTIMRRANWWNSIGAWIAISDFLRRKFMEAGVPSERIHTLRHFWRPSARGESGQEEEHYLYLGRLNEAKGVRVLLEAWQILETELGQRAPKLLIGGEGPLRSLVAERAQRMASIRFQGELSGEEKEKALRGAKAVIVPSVWWEPLGLVVYEAYDYHKPVLAAASGGLPEIVRAAETGLLHQPGNAAELARQVMELESSPASRRALGQEGRVWLEKNTGEAEWREKFSAIAAGVINRPA